jgi:hypothetical protein
VRGTSGGGVTIGDVGPHYRAWQWTVVEAAPQLHTIVHLGTTLYKVCMSKVQVQVQVCFTKQAGGVKVKGGVGNTGSGLRHHSHHVNQVNAS